MYPIGELSGMDRVDSGRLKVNKVGLALYCMFSIEYVDLTPTSPLPHCAPAHPIFLCLACIVTATSIQFRAHGN